MQNLGAEAVMRTLHTILAIAALVLAGACVSFDPSGQPMNDDAVEPEPEPGVDAGSTVTAPDAAPPAPDAEPDEPDARDNDDNSGPGNGGGNPGSGGDDD